MLKFKNPSPNLFYHDIFPFYRMFQTLPPLSLTTQKSFVIDSCDEFIALILKENGWIKIPKSSTQWNLKWTWRVSPKQYENLKAGQRLNHFKGSQQITTKLGLSLLYKKSSIILDTGKSFANFYPRSYNLSVQKQEFIKDFNNTAIFNLLKKIIVCLQLFYKQQYEEVLRLKSRLCIKNTEDFLSQLYKWDRIAESQERQQKGFKINGKIYLRLLFYLENFFSLQRMYSFGSHQIYEMSQYSRKQIPFKQESFEYEISPSLQSLVLTLIYYQKSLKSVNCFYQDGFSNIWIVKSNHSSRGRNINLISDLKAVQTLDNGMKLVQKYIQNIWILHQLTEVKKQRHQEIKKLIKKKFDIRFWVLVKSFNPLSVYVYDQAYLRISSQQYQLDFINQKTSHLTNYSVNWKAQNHPSQDQSFLLYSEFINYLKDENDQNVDKITRNIHQIILETLRLVDIKEDQRCFELFGFDIILDAKLNPWILQCNMSPACAPRGKLKNTLKQMTEGLLSLMGFINGNNRGWKSLTEEKIKQVKGKGKNNFKVLRQLRLGNDSINNLALNWGDLLIVGKRLQTKNYKVVESFHYFIEKVKYIQNFIRQKNKINFKNRNLQLKKPKRTNQPKIIKIVQILAKISRKFRRIYFINLFKIPKKRSSLRIKINNAIKNKVVIQTLR